MRAESTRERLLRHIESFAEPRNPLKHSSAWESTQDYLTDQLREMGREVLFQDFSTELISDNGDQVIGRNVLGEAKPEAHLVLVAHYDTVNDSPGADDNLSAVAVALEVARHCPNVHAFFPDLEEFGLQGSRHFVSSGKWSKLPALVLESVGYLTEVAGSQGFPDVFPAAFPDHLKNANSRATSGPFSISRQISSWPSRWSTSLAPPRSAWRSRRRCSSETKDKLCEILGVPITWPFGSGGDRV